MRADRLVATLLVLQARGRITAAELAEELEMSVATARRDLEALAMAGIPVYSQPGRNGGVVAARRRPHRPQRPHRGRGAHAVPGGRTVLGGDAARPRPPCASWCRRCPETFRAEAEAAASAVVLDPAGWGATAPPAPATSTSCSGRSSAGVQVRLGYADREGNESERTVHPLGLVEKSSVWYLVADTADGMRTFRVGRVRSVELTDEPVVKPEGFDLAEAWQSVVDAMDERATRSRPSCTPTRAAWGGCGDGSATRFRAVRTLPDGRVEVEIGAWSPESPGPRPGDLREPHRGGRTAGGPRHVRAIGAELVARYRAEDERRIGGPIP